MGSWLEFSTSNCFSPVAILCGASLVYITGLACYRLWLSPLADFPGPKLAALTGWYETYFELVKCGGGHLTFEIRRLHSQYGPIVRISPNELHFHDPEYYDTIYTSSEAFDKPAYLQHRFGAPHAAFSTPDHHVHKRRRGAISPFFARRKILEQTSMIQAKVDKVCRRFKGEYSGEGKVVCMNNVFASLITDVIMAYAFDRESGFIEQEDFVSSFTSSIQALKRFAHPALQFPWLARLIQDLPDSLVSSLQPAMKPILDFQTEMSSQVQRILQVDKDPSSGQRQRTIFHDLARSNLPPRDLEIWRLKDEAVSIVGAGIETTKMAATVTFFHVVNNPAIATRLRQELLQAIPDPENPPPVTALEQLPYLTACIQEGLRLSYGAVARSQRIAPSPPLHYGPTNRPIPAGSIISMDTYHMHHDEHIFPDSFTFAPNRWLDDHDNQNNHLDNNNNNNTTKTKTNRNRNLSRYLTSFGRGTRMCLGMNLAQVELTLVLAMLFRNFEFVLFDTDRTDVDCYRDLVGLEPRDGSLGVRVVVS